MFIIQLELISHYSQLSIYRQDNFLFMIEHNMAHKTIYERRGWIFEHERFFYNAPEPKQGKFDTVHNSLRFYKNYTRKRVGG